MPVPCLTTALTGPLRELETRILNAQPQIEHWFRTGAADGFNLMPPTLPDALEDFVDHVVPELQRRGLFGTHYTTDTLRGHLGLPRPARNGRTAVSAFQSMP